MFAAVASTGMAYALSPDPRIISMIPRNVEIVDGSGASRTKAGLMSFLVFRTENAVDLRDFRGLVGADASKTIRQLFLVGGTARPSPRFEHSVLCLGRFNHSRIYEAAIHNGARARAYRGMEILEVDPFTRDQGTINEVRWLAIVGQDLAVFGTIGHVVEELDRYLDHVPAESSLLERFRRFQRDDETWALLSETVQKDSIRRAFGSLDPRFPDLARDKSNFQFGIHYGSRIRVDYESAADDTSDPLPNKVQKTATGVLIDPGMRSFVSVASATINTRAVRGTLAIARTRYEKWLSELLNSKGDSERPAALDRVR